MTNIKLVIFFTFLIFSTGCMELAKFIVDVDNYARQQEYLQQITQTPTPRDNANNRGCCSWHSGIGYCNYMYSHWDSVENRWYAGKSVAL